MVGVGCGVPEDDGVAMVPIIGGEEGWRQSAGGKVSGHDALSAICRSEGMEEGVKETSEALKWLSSSSVDKPVAELKRPGESLGKKSLSTPGMSTSD